MKVRCGREVGLCFFEIENGAVVVAVVSWSLSFFFFFFFFFFLSHPNSYFVRIGVAEWLRDWYVRCAFAVRIP